MRLAFAVVLSALVFDCSSQKLLFHKNRFKEVFYKNGEIITLGLKANNSRISARIIGFEENLIVFRDFKVDLKEVSHVYVDDKNRTWFILRYKYKSVLPIVGFGYALLDFINTGSLSKETVVIGSSFIAAGLLAKILISDKIKIRGKRKLATIH